MSQSVQVLDLDAAKWNAAIIKVINCTHIGPIEMSLCHPLMIELEEREAVSVSKVRVGSYSCDCVHNGKACAKE